MLLSDGIKDYLLFLQHEQGAAKTTLKAYRARLHNLTAWLASNGYPDPTLETFATPILRRYLYSLSGRGLRPRTIRGFFNAIRSLGQFLVTQGAMTENPSLAVGLPKKDAAQRETVSEEELRELLQACERQRNPRQVALSRVVLAVLIYTGLRRAECLALRVSDADVKEKTLLVRSGKGGKSRKIYLCAECVTALSEWLAVRPVDCKHDWLFAYDRNRRINDMGLRTLIEAVKATAGYAGRENIKPHSLRHAAATRLMRNGADMKSIQTFLGHSMLQTTAVYLHTDEERLRDIAPMASLNAQEKQDRLNNGDERRQGRERQQTRLRRRAI